MNRARILSNPRLRRIVLLLGLIITGVVILAALAGKSRRQPEENPATRETRARPFEVGIPTLERVEAFVKGYGSRVDASESELARLRAALDETRKELKDSIAALARTRSEESNFIKSAMGDIKGQPAPDRIAARIRKFDFPASAEPDSARKDVYIPAGSFAEITLLTGIFAPVSGEALPIHARLDAALVGPNRSRIPIEGAFLVGRVQGDANSVRAIVQFQKLAFVGPDGASHEVPINADVADSDGILGLAGRYVWRAEEILTLSGLSGAAAGAAEALSARETSVTTAPLGGGTSIVNGDPARFAGFRGASKGLERISETLSKRLEEIAPAVYVPNSRKATVTFLDGVSVEGLTIHAEGLHETPRYPFRGLDFDR